MKSKLLSLFLALAASVGITFASVTIDGIAYNLNETDLTAEVTSGGSYSGNVVIPSQITYDAKTYRVTSIGRKAFYGCSGLTSVTIGNSVTSIGDYAFKDCSNLTSVTIGNNVTSITEDVFEGCKIETIDFAGTIEDWCNKSWPPFSVSTGYQLSLNGKLQENITLPNSITSIGYWAFYGCISLISVTIPNSVTSIGIYAFNGCSSLTSITIPSSVSSIGAFAFEGCKHVNKIRFMGSLEEWLNKSWTPNNISSNYALYISDDLQTNIIIPNNVTSIGMYTFYGCISLISVTIPNNVTVVKQNAFAGCYGLKEVVLGAKLKVIESGAFCNSSSIETITCYSMRPPTATIADSQGQGSFSKSMPYSTIIYVPAACLNTYKMHDFWGVYDVRPIGAATTETTSVQVTPSETTATVAWPTVNGAETYEMVIKDKQGNVICTLIFNSNGQLTEIAFNAPSRYGEVEQTQTAGFSFTVTGLEEGTAYELTITSKDSNGTTLDEKTIAFSTSGWTGVDALQAGEQHSSKIMRDGQVLIMRGEKMYNLQGVEVK